MSNYFFLILGMLSFSSFIFAQSAPFKGIVTYQDMGTPIEGVRIFDADKDAIEDIVKTNERGTFELNYVTKNEGDNILLQASLENHVVINEEEILHYTVPGQKENPNPYRIVMCQKEAYEKRYGSLRRVFGSEVSTYLEEVLTNLEYQIQYGDKLKMADVSRLRGEGRLLTQRVQEYAKAFATLDLSQALPFEKSALESIGQGDVGEALSYYEANLRTSFFQQEESFDYIKALADAYVHQATLYAVTYDYYKSAAAFDTALLVQTQYPDFFPKKLTRTNVTAIRVYDNLATVNLDLSRFHEKTKQLDSAIIYQRNAIEYQERIYISKNEKLKANYERLDKLQSKFYAGRYNVPASAPAEPADAGSEEKEPPTAKINEKPKKEEPVAVAPAEPAPEPEVKEEVVVETDKEDAVFPVAVEPAEYVVIKATSLRQKSTHKSKVLTRLYEGREVTVLEHTNEWWWKVDYKGRIGWVKNFCMKKK